MKRPSGESDRKPKSPSSSEFGDLIPREWLGKPWYVRVLLAAIGTLFIVAGLVGWLVPVIPGFFLVPVGVVLIAASSKWVARHVNAGERRLSPRARRFIHHPIYWCESKMPAGWQRRRRRPRRRKAELPKPAE